MQYEYGEVLVYLLVLVPDLKRFPRILAEDGVFRCRQCLSSTEHFSRYLWYLSDLTEHFSSEHLHLQLQPRYSLSTMIRITKWQIMNLRPETQVGTHVKALDGCPFLFRWSQRLDRSPCILVMYTCHVYM